MSNLGAAQEATRQMIEKEKAEGAAAAEGTEPVEMEDACSICLEKKVAPGDSVTKLPCGHSLHASCLENLGRRSVHSSDQCPLCRSQHYTDAACHDQPSSIALGEVWNADSRTGPL